MADYSLLGSFSTGGASALSGDVLTKLREAEEKSLITPLDTKLELAETEAEKILEIKEQVTAFQDIMKYFEVGQEDNVFTQKLMDTTGSSVVFESDNTSTLLDGKRTVSISQLAQQDIYQSSTFSNKEAIPTGTDSSDKISIQIGTGTAIDFETEGKTYEEIAQTINTQDGLTASVEKISDTDYRLIVKSTESGTSNALTITQTGLDLDFGESYTSDTIAGGVTTSNGSLDIDGTSVPFTSGDSLTDIKNAITTAGIANVSVTVADNKITIAKDDNSSIVISSIGFDFGFDDDTQTLKAQNLEANVDGTDYTLSSNTIALSDGLNIQALKVDDAGEVSTLNISKDTSAVIIAVEQMTTQYNTLKDLITTELNSSDSSITDKDSLRSILSEVKALLFNDYGAETPTFGSETDEYGDQVLGHSNVTNNDKNLFDFGFSLDSQGNLSVDTDELKDGLEDKMEDLKLLFVGSYENKGLGTLLSETLDSFDGYEGLLYNYDLKMIANKEDTEKEKEAAVKSLDTKYQIMAESFAAYGGLITQMESSFSGLKQMIAQSTASQ